MPSRNSLQTHLLIILVAVTLCSGVRIFLKDVYALERKQIEHRGRDQRMQDLIAGWNSLEYLDASSGRLTERCLAKIRWRDIDLTDVQKEKLQQKLREVFDYLQKPDPETFYLLRTRGLSYDFKCPPAMRQVFLRNRGFLAEADLISLYWDQLTKTNTALRHITSISPQSISVKLDSVNTAEAMTHGPVSKGFTRGESLGEFGFNYRIDAGSKSALFFNISFFARSNASRNGAPVYLSFAWAEPDKQWCQQRMITDVLLRPQHPILTCTLLVHRTLAFQARIPPAGYRR